jgi:hypothetical protein
MLRDIDDYAGKYYSHEWIRRNVLYQTEEDMEEIDKQIAEEADNEQYNPPVEMGADGQPVAPEDTSGALGPDTGQQTKIPSLPKVPDLVKKPA